MKLRKFGLRIFEEELIGFIVTSGFLAAAGLTRPSLKL